MGEYGWWIFAPMHAFAENAAYPYMSVLTCDTGLAICCLQAGRETLISQFFLPGFFPMAFFRKDMAWFFAFIRILTLCAKGPDFFCWCQDIFIFVRKKLFLNLTLGKVHRISHHFPRRVISHFTWLEILSLLMPRGFILLIFQIPEVYIIPC